MPPSCSSSSACKAAIRAAICALLIFGKSASVFNRVFSAIPQGQLPVPSEKEKARLCGPYLLCAEEDSNLHPVIPDQALNIVGQAVGPCKAAL